MLSRVAESIYWMNRYVERAENVARFIHVNLHLNLDMPNLGRNAGSLWAPLVWTTGDDKPFAERYGAVTPENVIQFLTFDLENPNSILSCVCTARENARCIREVISSEMWEALNKFYLMLRSPQAIIQAARSPHDLYTAVRTQCHLFSGVTEATMSHGDGWHFGRMGRLLERADKTSRILDVKYYLLLPTPEYVGMPLDVLQWAALLKSASALEMFRKQFPVVSPRSVPQFLILDREFPRAILYCVTNAEESLRAITDTPLNAYTNDAERDLGRFRAELSFTQIDEIIRRGLHEYLDDVQGQINTVDSSIRNTFFTLADIPIMQGQTQGQTQSQTQSIAV